MHPWYWKMSLDPCWNHSDWRGKWDPWVLVPKFNEIVSMSWNPPDAFSCITFVFRGSYVYSVWCSGCMLSCMDRGSQIKRATESNTTKRSAMPRQPWYSRVYLIWDTAPNLIELHRLYIESANLWKKACPSLLFSRECPIVISALPNRVQLSSSLVWLYQSK